MRIPAVSTRRLRLAFGMYACLLFAATHWPKLAIDMEIGRPDLVVHFVAFALWATFLNLAAFFGPTLNKRNIVLAAVVSLIYSAFDESTQLIEILHRHAGWADFSANVAGVLTASCFFYLQASRTPATRIDENEH